MTAEQVYDTYVDKIYKFFYIQCFDKQIAEDLTSKTFIAYLETVQNNQINNPKTYLYGTMRNIWMQNLRDKYKQPIAMQLDAAAIEEYIDETIADYQSASVADRTEVYLALLPPAQQQIVRLKVVQMLSNKEIAQMLNTDVNNVKANYKRGIKNLRQLIDTLPYKEAKQRIGEHDV